jgi:transposase
MNRKGKDLRSVYLRLKKKKKPVAKIAETIGVSRQTIYNWNSLSESSLFTEPSKTTVKPTFDITELREYMLDNPGNFYKETANVFGKSIATIHRYAKKFGITRKKFKTTYKEQKPELKKSS